VTLRNIFPHKIFLHLRNGAARMSFISSPIHRISAHSTSPILYLVSSDSVYKYNLQSSSVDATFASSNPSYPQFFESSPEWLFISGGDKYLRVLNANTLECAAELFVHKRVARLTIVLS
jgi:hypothetical protein